MNDECLACLLHVWNSMNPFMILLIILILFSNLDCERNKESVLDWLAFGFGLLSSQVQRTGED